MVDDLASVPDRALAPNTPHSNELVTLAEMVRRAIVNTLRETEEISSPPHVSSVLERPPSTASSKSTPRLLSQQTISPGRNLIVDKET
jgi:hypothetical protein